MKKVGLCFVYVGVVAWIVTGIVFFTSDPRRELITGGLVESDSSQLVAGAYIGLGHGLYGAEQNTTAHSEEAWSGTYYNKEKAMFEYRVPKLSPAWYITVFNGFGSMFDQLFPSRMATWGSVTSVDSYGAASTKELNTPLQPACVITITPNSVPHGGSATLSWTSRNAKKVILQGHGEVARSGSLEVQYLVSTRAYALAVGGEGGSSSCYTVINVEPQTTTL